MRQGCCEGPQNYPLLWGVEIIVVEGEISVKTTAIDMPSNRAKYAAVLHMTSYVVGNNDCMKIAPSLGISDADLRKLNRRFAYWLS